MAIEDAGMVVAELGADGEVVVEVKHHRQLLTIHSKQHRIWQSGVRGGILA